jgi:hypothetical protein
MNFYSPFLPVMLLAAEWKFFVPFHVKTLHAHHVVLETERQ